MAFLVWVSVLIGIAVVALVRARRRSQRQRSLAALCSDAGIGFSVTDPFPDTTFLPFPLFGGGGWRVDNVLWSGANERIRVFDYRREVTEERAGLALTCGVVPVAASMPDIAVLPRGVTDPVPELVVRGTVTLELEEFDRRFDARGEDRRAVVAFLDQRMMQTLLRLPLSVAIHVREHAMLLIAEPLPPAEMVVLLTVASALADRVPPVVASLYPPRPSEGPFEHRWLQGAWSPDPTAADASNPADLAG
jgi:hypothetical protein